MGWGGWRREYARLPEEYEGEDLVAEVAYALVTRSKSKASWYNPRRGTIGAYIRVVARSRLLQLVARGGGR